MSRTIALVEDDPDLQANYAVALRRAGFEVMVYSNRDEAMRAFNTRLPNLAILDVCLGDDNEAGFEICRELRQQSKTLPIIFLTALDSDFDTISGLRLGADDYLTKDISLPHLLARISALFRRFEALTVEPATSTAYEVGKLTVDQDKFLIEWSGSHVDLTLTEYWIVHSLTLNPGHVKSREQLMTEARAVVDDSTVTSHIKRIRKKFQAIDPAFDCIETVYGMGYRWVNLG